MCRNAKRDVAGAKTTGFGTLEMCLSSICETSQVVKPWLQEVVPVEMDTASGQRKPVQTQYPEAHEIRDGVRERVDLFVICHIPSGSFPDPCSSIPKSPLHINVDVGGKGR